MPNYVKHRLTITGCADDLTHIRKTHFSPLKNCKGEDYDYCWDFDTIIPMPQELKVIESDGISSVDEFLTECLTGKPYPTRTFESGVFQMKTRLTPISEMARHFPKLAAAASPADVVAAFEQMPPRTINHQTGQTAKSIDVARQRAAAVEACGYGDTLVWCTDVWGTKWGSFRCAFTVEEENRAEFVFETAWSVPTPIIHRFAAMYPSVTLHGKAFDEGWNFEANILAMGGMAAVESIKATDEGYAYVHGRPFQRDEEV